LAALGLRWDVLGRMVRVWREAADEPALSLVPQVDYLRDSAWDDPAIWATALIRAALRVLGEVTPDAREAGLSEDALSIQREEDSGDAD